MKNIILLLITIGVTVGVSMTVSAKTDQPCPDRCLALYNICINNGGGWLLCGWERYECESQCD